MRGRPPPLQGNPLLGRTPARETPQETRLPGRPPAREKPLPSKETLPLGRPPAREIPPPPGRPTPMETSLSGRSPCQGDTSLQGDPLQAHTQGVGN